MIIAALGLAAGALALWALYQLFFQGEGERVPIFAGGMGRLYNIAAIAFGAGGFYWVVYQWFGPAPKG